MPPLDLSRLFLNQGHTNLQQHLQLPHKFKTKSQIELKMDGDGELGQELIENASPGTYTQSLTSTLDERST